MIDPLSLALISPRFRAIALRLDGLPLRERNAAFLEWLAGEPDRDEILKAVGDADPYGPDPNAGRIANFRSN